ncbi:hypothetical protein C8R46DRAFT_1363808 [Mycena filopes]|nr:hypothetical protein C8R46DRAFT_1363808 [Mycena filopes]
MLFLTLIAPLLLAASSVVADRHSFLARHSHNAIARQAGGSGTDCTSQCEAYNSAPSTCNNSFIEDGAQCFTCMIQAGTVSQEDAQDTLNGIIDTCDAAAQPVTSISLVGSGTQAVGAASAQVSVPSASAATPPTPTTSLKGEAGPTNAEKGGEPVATDSVSANSTASSASGGSPPAKTAASGTGYALKTKGWMTAVLAVLSFGVTML